VIRATFSADGARVVTASADKTARVWDATTGVALAVLRGHTDQLVGASFSPDGSRVVTASVDRTGRIWRLDPIILISANQRQEYVCEKRLVGARSFTDREMLDPMLRGSEDLRHPCDRAGPLSVAYYRQAAAAAVATIRSLIAK
jgi:hypothetical protein